MASCKSAKDNDNVNVTLIHIHSVVTVTPMAFHGIILLYVIVNTPLQVLYGI